MTYNPWPLGQVPREFQRPELYQIKEMGYDWDDPRDVVTMFEEKVAKFAGSKYAVSVDCCTNGLFLCLEYLKSEGLVIWPLYINIPKRTYISVPMIIIRSLMFPKYKNIDWSGIYQLNPLPIWDGAVRWTKGMYVGNNALQVVSFQIKKRIPIGRGGMILTNDKEAYDKLKLMSYDGRDLSLPYNHPNHVKMLGYHMYMTPEDCARGIILMDNTPEVNEDSGNSSMYPDVEQMMKNI